MSCCRESGRRQARELFPGQGLSAVLGHHGRAGRGSPLAQKPHVGQRGCLRLFALLPLCYSHPPPTRRLQKHLPRLPPRPPDTASPTLPSPGAEFLPQASPLLAHPTRFPPLTFPSAPTRRARHVLPSPSQKRLLHRAFLNPASEPASGGFLFALLVSL